MLIEEVILSVMIEWSVWVVDPANGKMNCCQDLQSLYHGLPLPTCVDESCVRAAEGLDVIRYLPACPGGNMKRGPQRPGLGQLPGAGHRSCWHGGQS